jgi:hypothetical protein
VRGLMAIAASKIYRLVASERNTRISQSLVGLLLAVTVMGTVMYGLFDAARIARPVARIERFFGIEVLHPGPATTAITRPSSPEQPAGR